MDDDDITWDGIRQHLQPDAFQDEDWEDPKHVHSWSLDFDISEPPNKQLDNLTGDASIESDSGTKQTNRQAALPLPLHGSNGISPTVSTQRRDSDLADVRSLFLSALSEPSSPCTDGLPHSGPTTTGMPSDASPLSLENGETFSIHDGGSLLPQVPSGLEALGLGLNDGSGLFPSSSFPASVADSLPAWAVHSNQSPTATTAGPAAAGSPAISTMVGMSSHPSPTSQHQVSSPSPSHPQRYLSSVVKHHFNKQGLVGGVRSGAGPANNNNNNNGGGGGGMVAGSAAGGGGGIVGVLGAGGGAAGNINSNANGNYTTLASISGGSLDGLAGPAADPFLRSTGSLRSNSSVMSEHSMPMFPPQQNNAHCIGVGAALATGDFPSLSSSPTRFTAHNTNTTTTTTTHHHTGMGGAHMAATHTSGLVGPIGSPDVLSLSSSLHAPTGVSAEMLFGGGVDNSASHTPRVLYNQSPVPPGAAPSSSSSLSRRGATNLAATYSTGVIPPSLIQRPNSSSAALPASGYLSVVDPQRRKLQLPTAAIRHTKALVGRLTTPSLCLLYQAGRCRQGANCYQVHAEPDVVSTLRARAEQQVCCCAVHGDANGNMWNAEDHTHRSISIGRTVISLDRLAFTTGLLRVLTDERQTVPVNPSLLCRLQEQPTSCRYGADCKFLHVCREVLSASSISAAGTATSSSLNGGGSLHPLNSSSATLNLQNGQPQEPLGGGETVNASFSASHLLAASTSSQGGLANSMRAPSPLTAGLRPVVAAGCGGGSAPSAAMAPSPSHSHPHPLHLHSPSLSLGGVPSGMGGHHVAAGGPMMPNDFSGSFGSQHVLGSESSFSGFHKPHMAAHTMQASGSRAMSPAPPGPAFIGAAAAAVGAPRMTTGGAQASMFFHPGQSASVATAAPPAGVDNGAAAPMTVPQYVIQQVNSDGSVTYVPLQFYRDPMGLMSAASA